MSPQGTINPGQPSPPTGNAAVDVARPAAPLPGRPVEVAAEVAAEAADLAWTPTPQPGDPGVLFFGAYRRSGTTWLTAMLNSHPEVHMRNEGWLINDRGDSFDTWFNQETFAAWAGSREARGTWLRDLGADEAADIMRRAMLLSLMREAARRDDWKQWPRLRWIGDKTTMFYSGRGGENARLLHRLFPPPRGRFLSMVRDGRDAVVSHLFLIFRERSFDRLPPDCSEHAIAACEYHAHGRGPAVPLFNAPLLRHLVLGWVDCIHGARRVAELFGPGGGFCEVRYEDLAEFPAPELARVFRWLGVNAEAGLVERIVHDNRFERASGGRARGQEEPLAEWRKGVVGDWRARFTDDDKRCFKAIAGSLLVELGYEQGMDW